ncbi:non-heme iron oxygenase ferredoxin subunit [Pusillimonas sp. MFBS29]|uniref:non-heme iron oxygenase ferredoxin subunit n=1 Tax=Pusillimonas sp. MFBS29 TaxID=2886690 RepID=UPI001D123D6C|nr:non-heme iron oxygenase ferredoxin subunit [Pusillimonas sp. MFBS29]MCC2597214.1 non-heme iron oxygenase ferredoxin subunit [Pusillimonas sp. MFBS29]
MSSTENWIAVGSVSDISPDTGTLRVMVEGEAVCLYKLDDTVHATQDRCTHGQASLAEGYIEDGLIECPLHQGCFDIRTGAAVTAPCKEPIRVYPVKVEGDTIYVEANP